MKVAIVHDELMRRGGAEQVVLTMLKAYPKADLYTLCYKPELTYPEFKSYKIKTSKFQFLARNEKVMKWLFFPFGLLAMKMMKVSGYDVVLISTTYGAKYVQISPKSKVFIYNYTPFRLAWSPLSYKEYTESLFFKRFAFNIVISILKQIDFKAAQKANHFFGMTQETALRIMGAYKVELSRLTIIPPAVKTQNFKVGKNYSDYYLLVSRLEYYKKVDLAIETFNKLGYKLIVVGNGSKKQELMAMAKSNIVFKSGLSNEDLAQLYQNCKAFIFPQHEDYGITPLEANASGKAVIAFGFGGVLETMIPKNNESGNKWTAIFFNEQTVESLTSAVKDFESSIAEIDIEFIRQNAERFSEEQFISKLTNAIKSLTQ